MTNTQLKSQIDTHITNKTQPQSIDNIEVGSDLKLIVDYIDQQDLFKEDLTNKSTNIITDGASNIKYPSVKAVKDYVDSSITNVEYKELIGTISQVSSNTPALNIIKNTFTVPITLKRISAGTYSINISGLTNTDYLDKTICFIGSGNSPLVSRNEATIVSDGVNNSIGIYSYHIETSGFDTPTDSKLSRTPIHIIVKN